MELDFSTNEEPIVDETSEPAALNRPEGDKRPPDCYGEWATAEKNGHDNKPRTVRGALASPQKDKWTKGMEKKNWRRFKMKRSLGFGGTA